MWRLLRKLLLVGILGGIGDIASAAMTMKIMKEQQDFIKKQRRTAYQDTMKDMRKAGLNPILAYQRGPTTGTAAPTVTSPGFGGMGKLASDISGARQASAAKKQAKTAGSVRAQQEKLFGEQMRAAGAQADLHDATAIGVANQNVISGEKAAWAITNAGKAAIHGSMIGGGPMGTGVATALDMALDSLKGPTPYRDYKKPITIHSNPGGRPGGKK